MYHLPEKSSRMVRGLLNGFCGQQSWSRRSRHNGAFPAHHGVMRVLALSSFVVREHQPH